MDEKFYTDHTKKLYEKVDSCAIHVSMVTNGYLEAAKNGDFKVLIELAMSIVLDKPICLIVEEGSTIPENLKKIAHTIEYHKYDKTPESINQLSTLIKKITDSIQN